MVATALAMPAVLHNLPNDLQNTTTQLSHTSSANAAECCHSMSLGCQICFQHGSRLTFLNFSCPYLCNRSTLDWGIFDYFDLNWPEEHPLQFWQEPPGTLFEGAQKMCVSLSFFHCIHDCSATSRNVLETMSACWKLRHYVRPPPHSQWVVSFVAD